MEAKKKKKEEPGVLSGIHDYFKGKGDQIVDEAIAEGPVGPGKASPEYSEPLSEAIGKGAKMAAEDVWSGAKYLGGKAAEGIRTAGTGIADAVESGAESTKEFVKENPAFLMGATPVLMGFLTGDYESGYGIGSEVLMDEAQRREKLDKEAREEKTASAKAKGSLKPLTKSNIVEVKDEKGNPVYKRIEEAVGETPYEKDTFNLKQKEKLEEFKASLKTKDKDTFTNEQKLRKEFTANPITQDTTSIAQSFNKIQDIYGTEQSGAGDISMIFAYMKMLDPGSVVREGEQATARNAGTVPDSVRLMYNRLVAGENKLLPSNLRKDFYGKAKELYEGQQRLQNQVNSTYSSLSGQHGIDFNNVSTIPTVPITQKVEKAPQARILKSRKDGKMYLQMPDGKMKKIED